MLKLFLKAKISFGTMQKSVLKKNIYFLRYFKKTEISTRIAPHDPIDLQFNELPTARTH